MSLVASETAGGEAIGRPESDPVVRPRIWPLVLIALAEALILALPFLLDRTGGFFQFGSMVGGPALGSLLLLIWLLGFSRIPWRVRLIGALVGIGAMVAVMSLVNKEVSPVGVHLFGTPLATLSLAAAALCSGNLAWSVRWKVCLAVWCLGLAVMLLFRNDGMGGEMLPALQWRWSPTSESRYLQSLATRQATKDSASPAPAKPPSIRLRPGDWTGFRGAARDSIQATDRLATNWKESPPRQLWKRDVGPGWSSFAIVDGRIFTQEQRGEAEAVVCWSADTGEELWVHTDEARFWESVAGAGPRATPTFADGRLFTTGATGLVNCLDAATGKRIWSVDLKTSAGSATPQWGFAASPCVIGDQVFVQAGAPGDDLLALDARTGEVRWKARWDGRGRSGYCSAHPAQLDGVEQILVTHGGGIASYDLATGDELWRHELEFPNRIIQPGVLDANHVVLPSGESVGTRLLEVTREGSAWKVEPRWDAEDLEPNFSDMVAQGGHLYGFDRNIFVCFDATTGEERWKGGRYGSGQVVSLPAQGLLFVISEKGEAVLLRANPDRLEELGRFRALDGKTWNHPVIAHGRLYVRNGETAACYDIGERPEESL
jgi:outer membrane protein assembly factor BamB